MPYYVYILANENNHVLYTGVTNDLQRRLYEHKSCTVPGFTKQYNVHKLVFYEETPDVHAAISREKQLKSWNRGRKIKLVTDKNPDWHDLSQDWEFR